MSDAGGARVLVVDDHHDNRDLLQRRLQRRGFVTLGASSGEEALLMIDDSDAVLLDINMPGMSGLTCLEHIRQRYSLDQLPVIMVTARDSSEIIIQSLALGASDFVTKPIDYPVLIARLTTWLRLKELRDTREHFLRIASHDLRSPLTRVLTSADLISEVVMPGDVMPAEMHSLLTGIGEAAQDMTRIIQDFVDLHALEGTQMSLDLSPTRVHTLLNGTMRRQLAYANVKGISIVIADDVDALVEVDESRMEQVLDNLVGNAVKYSPTGTTVLLRCRLDGDAAVLEVGDEGPGLTTDDLDRVFQRYMRLSARPTAGEVSSGLGLSIAREIVEIHGGDIGVHNNPDGPGATFWVRLPRSAHQQIAEEAS